MGRPGSGRATQLAVELFGTVTCTAPEGCERQLSPLSITGLLLCNTHHRRWHRWATGQAAALPEHIETRETYPVRQWLYAGEAKSNVVHCQAKVRFTPESTVGDAEDGWVLAALCNSEARLRPAGTRTGWSTEPKRCGRCTGLLRRAGLVD
jgi:hypothetical protein